MDRKTGIIACETIRDELLKVKEDVKRSYPVVWLLSGFHNTPDKLKSTLQEKINAAEGFDTILLVMGYCGNSIAGVETKTAELIIPRVDIR